MSFEQIKDNFLNVVLNHYADSSAAPDVASTGITRWW